MSGMSKVYAPVCDDCAIYDNNVAAEPGCAVILFCRETAMKQLGTVWTSRGRPREVINGKMRRKTNTGSAG
jgi:hypothetical protein